MGTCHFLVSNGTQEAGYFMVLEIRFSIHLFRKLIIFVSKILIFLQACDGSALVLGLTY